MAQVPPMFPDSLSDQQILASGRALCRAKDHREQEAILHGRERAARLGANPWDLVYVCPEIVGATHPELLRSAAETEANTAYIAEKNAACRDPWPGRGVSSRPRPTTSCSPTATTAIWSTTPRPR